MVLKGREPSIKRINIEENDNQSPTRPAPSPAGGGPLSIDVVNLPRQQSSGNKDGYTPGSKGHLTRRMSHLSTSRSRGGAFTVPLTEKWILVPGLFVAVVSDEEEEEEEIAPTKPSDQAGSSGGSSSGAHEAPRTAAEILSTAGKECWWWSPEVSPTHPTSVVSSLSYLPPPLIIYHLPFPWS